VRKRHNYCCYSSGFNQGEVHDVNKHDPAENRDPQANRSRQSDRGMAPEIKATTGSEGFAMVSIRPLDPLTIEHLLEASP
jgi:hypothetical protein